MIEVADLGFGERLAERGHTLLPLFFPDHRQSFNVGEMFDAEFQAFSPRN